MNVDSQSRLTHLEDAVDELDIPGNLEQHIEQEGRVECESLDGDVGYAGEDRGGSEVEVPAAQAAVVAGPAIDAADVARVGQDDRRRLPADEDRIARLSLLVEEANAEDGVGAEHVVAELTVVRRVAELHLADG